MFLPVGAYGGQPGRADAPRPQGLELQHKLPSSPLWQSRVQASALERTAPSWSSGLSVKEGFAGPEAVCLLREEALSRLVYTYYSVLGRTVHILCTMEERDAQEEGNTI